jgi:DNA-binding CsgD family transcriptional regulator
MLISTTIIEQPATKTPPAASGWTVTGAVTSGERQTTVTVTWAGAGPPLDEAELRSRYRLSPTQARVALFLYMRRTNAEIAEALGISVNTARSHVEIALLKLGVTTRIDVQGVLDAVAVQRGLRAAAQSAEVRRQSDSLRSA